MPKIQKPQRIQLRAGSTGTKADIDINSPQFRAIEGVGKSIAGVAIRHQEHKDSGYESAYNADNSTFTQQLDVDLNREGVKFNHDAQNSLVEKSFKERREAIEKDLEERKVSKRKSKEILDDFDQYEKQFRLQVEKKQLGEDIELANTDKEREARELFKAGELEAGNAVIQGMEVSEATKRELADQNFQAFKRQRSDNYSLSIRASGTREESDVIIDEIEKDGFLTDSEKAPLLFAAKKHNISLHNAEDKVWLDQITEEIDQSFNINQLQAMKPPEGTQQKTINSFNSKRSAKVKALKIEKSTANIQAIDMLRKGQLLTEDLDSFNFDETERIFFENLINKRSQGLGKEAVEFSETAKDIKEWAFAGGGFFSLGTRESDIGKKDEIWNEINSGKYNSNAQLLLGSLMIEAEGLDAKDGEIDVALNWLDFDLSDEGGSAFSDVSKDMLARMGGVVGGLPITKEGKIFAGEDVDRLGFSKARIDPEDAWNSWQEIRALAEIHLREGTENIEEFRRLSKISIDKATTSSELTKLFNKRTEAAKTKRTRGAQ